MLKYLVLIATSTICGLTSTAQWQPRGLDRGNVIGFAETSEGVFCAVDGAGVYKSTDTTFHWEESRDGLGDVRLMAITDDGADGLIVATPTGLWHKLPQAGWRRIDDPVFSSASIRFVKRVSPSDIFVGGMDRRIFLSRNNGKTWEEVGRVDTSGPQAASDFAVGRDGRVWAVCSNLYFSSDWGETWQASSYKEQTGRHAKSLVIGDKMAVVVGSGASYSIDNMQTWSEVGTSSRYAMHSIMEYDKNFYVTGSSEVLVIPWTNPAVFDASAFGFNLYAEGNVQCVFVTSSNAMIVGTNRYGVYKRTHFPYGGLFNLEWTHRSGGINAQWVRNFGVTPNGWMLFMDDYVDVRSKPGQLDTMFAHGGYRNFLGIMQKHPDGRIMSGFHEDPPRGKSSTYLYYSDDDGDTWTFIRHAQLPDLQDYYREPDWADAVGMMDSNSDSLLLGFSKSRLYSASTSDTQLSEVTIGSRFNDGAIWFGSDYIVGGNPISYFDQADSTWRTAEFEGNNIDPASLLRSASGAFYAVSKDGLLKSLDNAQTFFQVSSTFDNRRLNDLVVINDDQLIVSDSNDIYATSDGGATWRRINRNLPPSKISAIDADKFGDLYVAFYGAGIWSCPWDAATTSVDDDAVDTNTTDIVNVFFDEHQDRIEVRVRSCSGDQVNIAVFDVRGYKCVEQIVTDATAMTTTMIASHSLSTGAYYVVAWNSHWSGACPIVIAR